MTDTGFRVAVSHGALAVALMASPLMAQTNLGTPAGADNPKSPPAPVHAQKQTAEPLPETTSQTADNPSINGETAPPSANGNPAGPNDIVVTGFRRSLAAGLALQREAIGERNSIVAEDIGKFPEQNVADSLQRIPGVRLSRDPLSNEGQRISIRGLGPQYAVTTIDGAPVRTTSSQNVGTSVRDFNYDVFPSELFGRVDVYKTPLANLTEGGIGGNVDLQTPRPFDSKGQVIRYSVQGNYNTQSKAFGPRGSALYSNTWGNFGVLVGVAYSKNTNERSGFQSTGGYNSSAIASRAYQTPAPAANTSGPFPFQLNLNSPLANLGSYTQSQVLNAFLPRFYRDYASRDERQRLGSVASIQYKTDRLEISADGIYSDLKDSTGEYTFGVGVRNSRTVPGSTSPAGTGTNSGIIPVNISIDQYNNLYGTFDNTSITTESFYRDSQTKFYFGVLRGVWDMTDHLRLYAQGNFSRSNAVYTADRVVSLINGIQTTFDPTKSVTYPTISSPVDFTNPANFTNPSLGFSLNREIDTARTGRADFEWKPEEFAGIRLNVNLGGSYVSSEKKFGLQDGSSIASTRTLPSGGTFATSNPFSYMDPYIQIGRLDNGGNPGYLTEFATFPRSYVIDYLDANGANRQAVVNKNSAFDATENVGSAWLEINAKKNVFGRELRVDAGIRYSDTSTIIDNYKSSAGTFVPNTSTGGYRNWLPSGTFAYDLTKNLVLRGSAGKTITRAALQNIAASLYVPNTFSGAYTVGNPNLKPQTATTVDADLEWYFNKGGLLSVGAFQKTLKGTTTAFTDQVTLADSGLSSSAFNNTALGFPGATIPGDYILTRTTYVNQGTIKLKGLEAAYQQTFNFLPAPFDGLGALASFTYIKSQGYDFVLQGASTNSVSVAFVPKINYSVTAYYEKGRFSLRGSYNYFAKSATSNINSGNNQIPYNSAAGYLDANVSYRIFDWLELRVDALNLTNVNTYVFYDDPTGPKGAAKSRRDNSFYNGRTISFGIRGKF